MSSYEKCALRPLGFGSTNSRAPCTVAGWNPGLITGAPSPLGFGGPSGTCPITFQRARYIVTPTKATIAGRKRSIFFSRICQPSRYSSGLNVSMPGVGRAIRFVIPIPHAGRRTSSSCVTGSGTIPAS
jgi:hypothetical protein